MFEQSCFRFCQKILCRMFLAICLASLHRRRKTASTGFMCRCAESGIAGVSVLQMADSMRKYGLDYF